MVLGLAVADLCLSLNRLLSQGAKVRWDWHAPVAAVIALLKIVTQWWIWFKAAPLAKNVTFAMYVGLLLTAVLLFLLASAALPDEVGEEGVDLRAFYDRTSQRFWLIFLLHWLVFNAVGVWIQMQVQHLKFGLSEPLVLLVPAVALAAAFIRWRHLQNTVLLTFALFYLTQSAGDSLGA